MRIWIQHLLGIAVFAGFLGVPASVCGQDDFVKVTTPLSPPRAFHGSAVLGDFIYSVGGTVMGTDGKQHRAAMVSAARISPTGQLSRWIDTTAIPNSRHYVDNSTLVYNDTIYVLGGSDQKLNGVCSRTVLWTRPLPNGLLMNWNETSPFADVGLTAVTALSTPGYIHMIGGLADDQTVSQRVWSVRVNADGTLGEWESGPPLPEQLWFHSSAVVGGRVFVWGGLHNDVANQRFPSKVIYSATIRSNGKLANWQVEPVELPVGMYSAVTAVAGPYVFSILPRYDQGKTASDVWWTYVTPEGMKPWTKQTTQLPNKVYRASATDYRRGIIYITGGKVARGVTNPQADVYYIKLSPSAREAAEKTWLSQQSAAAAASGFEYQEGDNLLAFQESEPTAAGPFAGFQSLANAQVNSSRNRERMVMLFYDTRSKPTQNQMANFGDQKFKGLLQKNIMAAIDARVSSQTAQNYGVFRAPTWIFYDKFGTEVDRHVGILSAEQMEQKLNAVQ